MSILVISRKTRFKVSVLFLPPWLWNELYLKPKSCQKYVAQQESKSSGISNMFRALFFVLIIIGHKALTSYLYFMSYEVYT